MKLQDILTAKPKETGNLCRPYIIAEIGVNHENNLNQAFRLIELAKEGGADAVKFQTYKAGKIASKHSPSYWDTTKEPTKSQYELFQKYDSFSEKEYRQLKEFSDKLSIEFLSTPFDFQAAEYLNTIMDVFKISSSDITNLPFIEHICKFKKPIILSTGASYLYEIEQAVEIIENHELPYSLLHCVLNYPTDDKNANLGAINSLKHKFPNAIIGYSDHTLPKDLRTLETAFILGAQILEKHFTHDKTLPGNDHYHAMDKEDLKYFRANCERIIELYGNSKITSGQNQEPARKNARRSIVANCNIPKDTVIEAEHLTQKRPAHGISPVLQNQIIGKKTIVDISEDDVLQFNMIG